MRRRKRNAVGMILPVPDTLNLNAVIFRNLLFQGDCVEDLPPYVIGECESLNRRHVLLFCLLLIRLLHSKVHYFLIRASKI